MNLSYDEVYAVIDWLKIELTERFYPNSRHPGEKVKVLAVRQSRYTLSKVLVDKADKYYIWWDNKGYSVGKHTDFSLIDSVKLCKIFDEYFDFNHENRGKKMTKRFGI